MGKLLTSINALPRAVRWAVYGLAAFALYFLVVEPAIDRTNALANRADMHEATLRTFTAEGGSQQKHLQTLELGMRHFGEVEFLGDESTRPMQFNEAVDRILREHAVSNPKSSTKPAALGTGVLTSKMGNEYRVVRIVRDIEFDATPEAVAAVVAELERTPVVATVSRVMVRRLEGREAGDRTVHATVTAEAWVAAKKG
jgi:hypothetical protein